MMVSQRHIIITTLCLLVLAAMQPAHAKDRRLFVAGGNTSGQLGIGAAGTAVPVFTQVPGLLDVRMIAAGNSHSLVVTGSGTLWLAGLNNNGQLGLGNNTQQPAFVQVPGYTDVTAIAGGAAHSLVVRNNDLVYATGYNYYGGLGVGDNGNRTSFQQSSGVSDVAVVKAQDYGSGALVDGTLYSTGANDFGALGLGDTTHRNTFTVTSQGEIVSLAGGSYYFIVVTSDGEVYSAGLNSEGQLGLGDNDNRSSFTEVPGVSGASSVVSSARCSVLIMSDGSVKVTGRNDTYQLGLGDTTYRNAFATVPGLSQIVDAASGTNHTLAVKSDGTLWGAGSNSSGQLGLPKVTVAPYFTRLPGIDGVFAVSAGRDSLVAAWYGVEVTHPTEADTVFEMGERTVINWNSFNLSSKARVKIELVKRGVETWTLSEAAANTGAFRWTVGQWKSTTQEVYPEGDNFRIRITTPGGDDSDESDFEFAIARVAGITVNGPTDVNVGDSPAYTCTARFSTGDERDVTNMVKWSCSSKYAKMDKTGHLVIKPVPSPQVCTLTAAYGKGKPPVSGALDVNINPAP